VRLNGGSRGMSALASEASSVRSIAEDADGSIAAQSAVSVVCWGGMCGLGSLERGLLNPRNTPKFGHKLSTPEA
jgi:hypothetical protein